MKILYQIIFLLFCILSMISCKKNKEGILEPKIVTDTYYDVHLEDDYRYVEDIETPKVVNWVDQQNNRTQNYFSQIESKRRLIEIQKEHDLNSSFEINRLIVTNKGQYFYLKRFPNENVAKLYYRKSFDSTEVLIYDPIQYNSETEYIINYFQPNWTGDKIVVSLTSNGKEISDLIIIDVHSKSISPTILKNAWPRLGGGIQWLPDNSGFTYAFFPELNQKSKNYKKNSKIVYYKIGLNSDQIKPVFSKNISSEVLINEDDVPLVSIVNEENQYVIGSVVGANTYSDSYYKPIKNILENNPQWKPLFSKSDLVKNYILKGDSIIYTTAKNSPNFKIATTSITNPDFENPKILVKENENEVITDFTITKEGLFYVMSKNGVEASLWLHQNNNEKKKIELPETYGNVTLYSLGNNSSGFWFYARGWTTPITRYIYKHGILTEKNIAPKYVNENLKDLIVKEIEVKGHDGTMIPLSIIHKKGIKLDGSNRVLMGGYGTYGIPLKPIYSLRRMLWVHEGGIYAVSHVRGGGEKGDDWHKEGLKEKKPNTWKDFISCAEYLIDNKYTSKDKLAVWSGSAGGILIGRAITERPDLFKAAIVEFGAMNLVRYETIKGLANQKKEFGSITDSLGFKTILEMDAYHHLEKNTNYPSTFLTHGLNDPRLPAWQTLKFAAKIQNYNTSDNPNLIWIIKDTGHAVDDTKQKEFERYANIMAFALWQTGHPDYQLKK